MRKFIGQLVIGLAVFGAICSARPASAQTFEEQIAALKGNISGPFANCFECGFGRTLLNLLDSAQAAHTAGDSARCRAIIDMAVTCLNTPSRDLILVSSFNLGPPRTIGPPTGTGLLTPISVVISFLSGFGSAPPSLPGPVLPVYKFFSYTTGGFIDLLRYNACRFEAHDQIYLGLVVLIGLC
jgi:hypothetical protein